MLEGKERSCDTFVNALKDTMAKRVIHNVASAAWGIGTTGDGKPFREHSNALEGLMVLGIVRKGKKPQECSQN